MEGVILTIDKEELLNIISQAVACALVEKEESQQELGMPDSGIMQTEQLCEYLKIKRSAVYQLTTYKRIPFYKRGKRIFFKKGEIDEWLRNGRKAAVIHTEEEDRLTKAGIGRK